MLRGTRREPAARMAGARQARVHESAEFRRVAFERYLTELANLTTAQLADDEFIRELGERYDIWQELS